MQTLRSAQTLRFALTIRSALTLRSAQTLRFALYALAAFIVVDGDTIKAPFGPTYRILGYDSPETHFAKCEAERELGLIAKARVEQLFAHGEVRVLESGKIDKYRRSLAKVTVDGQDLAIVMIGEGLARPYHGERRQSWCNLGT
jgi:micrococcal nuclease